MVDLREGAWAIFSGGTEKIARRSSVTVRKPPPLLHSSLLDRA
jgi:hypothetical protein